MDFVIENVGAIYQGECVPAFNGTLKPLLIAENI